MAQKTNIQQFYGSPVVLPQGAYPELMKSIHGEGTTQADTLRNVAIALLEQNGTDSYINGMPARVTKAYAEVITENNEVYRAKVAQYTATRRSASVSNDIMVVFDANEDERVQTMNPFSLVFKQFAGSYSLVVNNDLDPLVDDAKYMQLTMEILRLIGENITAAPKRSAAVGSYIATCAQTVRKAAGEVSGYARPVLGAAALIGVLFAHVPLGNEDATIGPVPMPVFIEALVDLNNRPDHIATGFAAPVGAARLEIGGEPVHPPLIASYNTAGVPSSLFEDVFDKVQYNESKPGLYAIAIPQVLYDDYRADNQEEVFNEQTGCYEVRANTSGGRTTVFTQSQELADSLTVQAVDGNTIAVCAVQGKNLKNLTEGSVYFFQETQ
jgi:hypothetical protein